MKKKYGHMACPDCAARVVVKVNEHGTLSYTCDECDSAAYCKQGAGNRAAWEKKIAKAGDPPPKGEKKDEKPAPKKTAAFEL